MCGHYGEEPAATPRVHYSSSSAGFIGPCSASFAGDFMKFLVWIGMAMVVCWGILWLGIKIAVGAVHLLLVLGVVLIVWGFVKGKSAA
jgi:Flp pilus assembly protein TadB